VGHARTWAGRESGFEPGGIRGIPGFGANAKEGREKCVNGHFTYIFRWPKLESQGKVGIAADDQ
jgi:hypothetical protein